MQNKHQSPRNILKSPATERYVFPSQALYRIKHVVHCKATVLIDVNSSTLDIVDDVIFLARKHSSSMHTVRFLTPRASAAPDVSTRGGSGGRARGSA